MKDLNFENQNLQGENFIYCADELVAAENFN